MNLIVVEQLAAGDLVFHFLRVSLRRGQPRPFTYRRSPAGGLAATGRSLTEMTDVAPDKFVTIEAFALADDNSAA